MLAARGRRAIRSRTHLALVCSLASALGVAGCDDDEPTGVLVAITAQGRTTEIVDTLEIRTFGGSDAPTSATGEQRYPLPAGNPWPVLVGITPRRGDTDRVWALEIRALRIQDGTGDLQLVRRVIGTYARGKVVLLHIELEDLCLLERNRDLECGTTLARTCLQGGCQTTPEVDPEQLPEWDGTRPTTFDSGTGAEAGGEDASDFDLGGETRDGGDAGDAGDAPDGRADGGPDGARPDTGPVACTRDGECDDGIACTVDRCVDDLCEHGPDDGLCATTRCTAAVRCLPDEGGCVEETLVCDDGISCTDDSCAPASGCVYTPNDARCAAGATCDLGVLGCRGGSCSSHADCADADLCNTDRCVDGICEHPPGMACVDSDPCTDSRCVPETGACEVTNNTAFCDDGDRCTAGDRCAAGTCVGTPITCGSDPCATGTCDEATGMCSSTNLPDGSDCGSGRACCSGRCTNTASDPMACGMCGRSCGANQTCASGSCRCTAPWIDCTAAPGCETNPETDPMHCSGCDMPCDAGQSCVMGVCQACTSDTQCTPSLACQAGSCDAGECTISTDPGFCVIAGVCVVSGAANPANQCESCQPGVSQTGWSPRAGSCNDNLYCNTGETCVAGSCSGGSPRVCDDGRACTMDACDEAGDRCNDTLLPGFCLISGTCRSDGETNPMNPCQICTPALSTTAWSGNDGAACTDAQFCTTNACAGTSCGVTGTIDCSDAFACTTDTCNEGTDSCDHPIDAGSCLIDSVCRTNGEDNPANECEECLPTTSQTAWTDVMDGTPCSLGACQGGICEPGLPDAGPPADAGVIEDGDITCRAPGDACMGIE